MDPNRYSLSPGGAPIQCHLCQATFTRQQHLSRHVRSHRAERPFHCGQCDKSFTRLDVLHRHGRSHKHQPSDACNGSRRACKECVLGRVRCSRGRPCERCAQKHISCEYPPPRRRKRQASGTPPCEGIFFQAQASEHPLDSPSIAALPVASPVIGLSAVSQVPPLEDWLPSQSSDTLPGTSPAVPSGSNDMPTVENPTLTDNFGEWVGSMTALNWLSPQGFHLLPDAQLECLLLPENRERVPQMSTSTVPGNQAIRSPSREEPLPTAAHRSPTETHGSMSPPQPPDGAYYVDGRVGRAPFKGRSSWRTRRASAEHRTPGSGSGEGSQRSFMSEKVYRNHCESLAAECHRLGLGLDMASIPSLGEVRNLVQLYFEGFHPTYPFLRKSPSLFLPESHWILLLAVAATGSRCSSEARDHRLGNYLVLIVDRVLSMWLNPVLEEGNQSWNPGSKSPSADLLDVVTLQAILLNSLSLLQSGKEKAVRHALRRRYRLIEAYHALDLGVSDRPALQVLAEESPADAFERWLEGESRIRTGWMIWFLDCIAIYQFRCTPLIHLAEANVPLPCQEDFWDTSLPSEAFCNLDHQSVTLLDALEALYMEKTLPPNLGDLSTIVIVFAICRRNQEAIIESQTKLTHWSPSAKKEQRLPHRPPEEGWPPPIPSLSRWRNSACDSLDILHWNANSIAARMGGWEHPTILHLHLARLLLLAPIQHIQTLDVHSLTSSSSSSSPDQTVLSASLTTARCHTLRWAIRDQYKARLCLVHAGALLWHVRRYSSNSFLEPFGVYAATLTMWAYSIVMQMMRGHGDETSCPSDIDPPHEGHCSGTNPADGQSSDIETEPVIIQLDRPCDDEIVQAFVRAGHGMSARMNRVGDIRDSGAPRRILAQGIRLLNGSGADPDSLGPNWGVEQSYIDSLFGLMEGM